jgi:hypothetical protein
MTQVLFLALRGRTYADILVDGLTGGTFTLNDVGSLIGIPGSLLFATGQESSGYLAKRRKQQLFLVRLT